MTDSLLRRCKPLAVLALLALSGCGPKAPITAADAASCFPSVSAVAARANSGSAVRSDPRLYVDASGSMYSFGTPETTDGYTRLPFREMLGTLLDMGPTVGHDLDIRGFGVSIKPAQRADVEGMARGRRGFCPDCDSRESRLNDVLSEIQRDQPAIAFVTTDLWLANSAVLAHGMSELVNPLTEIMRRGDVIAVLGVDAPYKGPVYDMPRSSVSQAATYNGPIRRRPLFVLVIGQRDLVLKAVDKVRNDAFSGAAADTLNMTIYDPDVFRTAQPPQVDYALGGEADRIVQSGTVLQDRGLFIDAPQFSVNQAEAERVRIARSVRPADAPANAGQIVGSAQLSLPATSVWEGDMKVTGKIFTNVAAKPEEICLPASWVEADGGDVPGVVSGEVRNHSLKVVFEAGAEPLRLLAPDKIHYFAFQASMKTLASPNPASRWMAERGFTAEPQDVASVVSTPREVFPTLNLAEFASRLDAALSQQLAGQHVVSGGFAFEMK
jgi:hypothetical protein